MSLIPDYLWWKLDDASGTTSADATGNSRTGTTQNSPSWGTGQVGGCIVLNGTSQYISGGTGLTGVDLSDKTITAWIKKTANSEKGIVDKDFDSGSYGGWGFWMHSDGKLRWWVHSGKDFIDNGSNTITLGSWTHVAVVWNYSGKTAYFYINGVFNSSINDNTITENSSGSADFQVGNLRNNLSSGTYAFDGSLDDVRIFSRTLTAQEISQLHNQGRGMGVE